MAPPRARRLSAADSHDAEYEVHDCKQADSQHDATQIWPDDAVAHADNQEHEEGDTVACCIEDGHQTEVWLRKTCRLLRFTSQSQSLAAMLAAPDVELRELTPLLLRYR